MLAGEESDTESDSEGLRSFGSVLGMLNDYASDEEALSDEDEESQRQDHDAELLFKLTQMEELKKKKHEEKKKKKHEEKRKERKNRKKEEKQIEPERRTMLSEPSFRKQKCQTTGNAIHVAKSFEKSVGKVDLKKGSNGVAKARLKCKKGGMASTGPCEEDGRMLATITVEKVGKGVACIGVCKADVNVHLPPYKGSWTIQSNGFACSDGKLLKNALAEWKDGDVFELEYNKNKGILRASHNGDKNVEIKGIKLLKLFTFHVPL